MNSYQDLIVWQKSIVLVKKIFIATGKYPKSELYGIVSQMRRAAVSIPSNIAEGYGRKSRKEYAQFISIAYGSGAELETQLIISRDLEFMKEGEFHELNSLLTEVQKMLNAFLRKLELPAS